MSTKTSDFGKIKSELVLEPVDGIAGTTSEDFDEVITSEITGLRIENISIIMCDNDSVTHGFLGIVEERLVVIGNTEFSLCLGTSAVDSGGGFGGITTHETGRCFGLVRLSTDIFMV